MSVLAMVSVALEKVAILVIDLSPNLPSVLPDNNLLGSCEIDLAVMDFTREEALNRLNLGYM